MSAKDTRLPCALVIVTEGFEETQTIGVLSALRQAGVWVKSVALTRGLVRGAHGVCLMPDLALADVERWLDTASINLVVLPEGERSLARLEADPRLHQLLRQVVARHGQIATGPQGLRVPRAAAVWANGPGEGGDECWTPVLLRQPEQSPEAFARDLIHSLKEPSR